MRKHDEGAGALEVAPHTGQGCLCLLQARLLAQQPIQRPFVDDGSVREVLECQALCNIRCLAAECGSASCVLLPPGLYERAAAVDCSHPSVATAGAANGAIIAHAARWTVAWTWTSDGLVHASAYTHGQALEQASLAFG